MQRIAERPLQPPDQRYLTKAQTAEIQRRTEERASIEAETCRLPFVEWLGDFYQMHEVAPIIAQLISGTRDSILDAHVAADKIVAAYREYRVANVSADEWAEIADDVTEEA